MCFWDSVLGSRRCKRILKLRGSNSARRFGAGKSALKIKRKSLLKKKSDIIPFALD